MNTEQLLSKVDNLIRQGESVLSTTRNGSIGSYVDSGKMSGFRTACLSFIEKLFGAQHPYFQKYEDIVSKDYPACTSSGIEILKSIKTEIQDGWIFTLKGLISAEIFSDFLEMSEHLLEQGYKDPAAVIIGSVLEEHLRQLCLSNGIEITTEVKDRLVPKKADRLNNDLASGGIYNKLDQKSITSWLDLRNKAAHGKYEEYEQSQVQLMYQSVLDFIGRTQID